MIFTSFNTTQDVRFNPSLEPENSRRVWTKTEQWHAVTASRARRQGHRIGIGQREKLSFLTTYGAQPRHDIMTERPHSESVYCVLCIALHCTAREWTRCEPDELRGDTHRVPTLALQACLSVGMTLLVLLVSGTTHCNEAE
jgi:hypothetical protein